MPAARARLRRFFSAPVLFRGVGLASLAAALLVAQAPAARAADTIRFWNLTSKTVSEFSLAPAGTKDWGPNQCLNDKDKEVDHDERLRITGIQPGTYDARIGYRDKRVCYARGIEIKSGEVFLLEDSDLKDCSK